MDDFKKKTVKDYTAWDLNCPHICRKTRLTNKLKLIFKRKARRSLKREIEMEEKDEKNI